MKTRKKIHKNIYKNGNTYHIIKSINNKSTHFKTCKTLNEAINYRNQLIKNNWKPLPLTEEEKLEKNIKQYYKRLHLNSKKTGYYVVRNIKDEYLANLKNIEEALYYRDLYSKTPKNRVPKPDNIDLKTNNPYLENGLKYPIPERLILTENNSKYGKGSIIKKGETSYHIYHGKKEKGNGYYVCACPTIEMAEYVRAEMNKVGWDRNELQRILDNYPRYYTWLLFFYQYISKRRVRNGGYKGWEITIPKEFLEKDTSLEKIGPYNNIEDALFERDFLMEHDWDYNVLVETIDDKDNPYYSMDLPTYPTRKIRNIRKRDYHEKELLQVIDLINEDNTYTQNEIMNRLNLNSVSLRNWLRLWNTNWSEFRQLVIDGVNPLSVLEKEEQIIQPDLSTAKPNNYNGYVHCKSNGVYQIVRKNVYYGSYPSEDLARKIVNDLVKVDWDKSNLKKIQAKYGYVSPVGSKRWVYSQGNKWAVRRKDKDKRMLTYGSWYDKRIAVLVRDMLILYGWELKNMMWIEDVAVRSVEMIDSYNYTMFGRSTVEDIQYINSVVLDFDETYIYKREGKYEIMKSNIYYGRYESLNEAKMIRGLLIDNDWDKDLLKLMQELGEI